MLANFTVHNFNNFREKNQELQTNLFEFYYRLNESKKQ